MLLPGLETTLVHPLAYRAVVVVADHLDGLSRVVDIDGVGPEGVTPVGVAAEDHVGVLVLPVFLLVLLVLLVGMWRVVLVRVVWWGARLMVAVPRLSPRRHTVLVCHHVASLGTMMVGHFGDFRRIGSSRRTISWELGADKRL